MTNTLTVETLKLKGACATQVELSELSFPDGADLTAETALPVAHRFEWDWVAQKLLLPENLDAYKAGIKPACDARDAALKLALDTYNATEKPPQEVYYAVESAREAYYVVKAAVDARNTAVNSARDVYDVARARMFAELYIKQEHTK